MTLRRFLRPWPSFVVLSFALLSWRIFAFSGLPYFRDLITFPFYYNLLEGRVDLVLFERTIYNGLVTAGVPAVQVSRWFYQTTFFTGLVVTYLSLRKISRLVSPNVPESNKIFAYLLTCLYVFNPWVYERFLMGQYTVFRGHLFFLLAVYLGMRAIEELEAPNSATSSKNIFWLLGFALSGLTLISTHHGLLASVLLVYLGGWNFLKRRRNFSWLNLRSLMTKAAFVFIFPLLILLNRYANFDGAQQTYFFETISQNPGYESEIIRAFSAIPAPGTSLVSQVLIGAASWMTPSFIEPEEGRLVLGGLQHLTYYYTPELTWLAITFSGIGAYLIFRKVRRNKLTFLYPLSFLLPVSLLLSFGYSGPLWQRFNSWFYLLPFSYSFREPGKFYSLFLALFILTSTVVLPTYRKKIRIGATLGLSGLLVSNLLLFVPLTQTTIYYNLPAEITTEVSRFCSGQNPERVLFYPFQTYVRLESLDTYTTYPYAHLTTCSILKPNRTSVRTSGGESLTLFTSEIAESVDKTTNAYLASQNSSQDFQTYITFLHKTEITVIVLDSTHYPELEKLSDYLDDYLVNQAQTRNLGVYFLEQE